MSADATHPVATRQVRCPTCGGPSLFAPSNRWRPFCSERCRSVDLGAWASERFRVPAEAPPDGGAADAPGDIGDNGSAPARH